MNWIICEELEKNISTKSYNWEYWSLLLLTSWIYDYDKVEEERS